MAGKIITVLLFLFACNNCFYGQQSNPQSGSKQDGSKLDNKKTNLEILEQNISGELDKFFYYPDVNRGLQFVFFVHSSKKENNETKFIQSVIKKTADKNKIKISFAKDENSLSTDSAYYKADVDIIRLNTNYPKFGKNRFLGEKTLVREITSDLDIEITHNNGASLIDDKINTVYKGEIPYDNYEQFQTDEYRFTRAVPPNISFIETIIFPAAIIVVSAAATILFFTVRSK